MSAPARLIAYGAGLVLVFGALFIGGRALIPEDTVANWNKDAKESGGDHSSMGSMAGSPATSVRGLAVEQDGYRISPVSSPSRVGEKGDLSFRVYGPDGKPFTNFAVGHQKKLHLIVVRSDGDQFRHAHPTMDQASGTWSLPWEWTEGGTYRVYADFIPADVPDAPNVTLTNTAEVAGEFTPATFPVTGEDEVDGFEVTLVGDLKTASMGELTATVTRDGKPVRDLQPYLGAFGHLVALREGDMAYLHVHAEGDEPQPGDTAGPRISFSTEAPTPGRYLMYLDFKVEGQVHTAKFVLEAK